MVKSIDKNNEYTEILAGIIPVLCGLTIALCVVRWIAFPSMPLVIPLIPIGIALVPFIGACALVLMFFATLLCTTPLMIVMAVVSAVRKKK